MKSNRLFMAFLILIVLVAHFQNCSKVDFKNTRLEQPSTVTPQSGPPPAVDSQPTVPPPPAAMFHEFSPGKQTQLPPLKMIVVADNSYTMSANNIALSKSFADMFNSKNNENLTPFDVSLYLINTAQKSSVNIPNQLLSKEQSLKLTAADAQSIRNNRTGTIPGDFIGFSVIQLNSQRTEFHVAPTLTFSSSGTATEVIRKPAGLSADSFIKQFQDKISFQTLQAADTQYSQITDNESGLCAISRLLHKPDGRISSNDLLSIIIASDENDQDPTGASCVTAKARNSGSAEYYNASCDGTQFYWDVTGPGRCNLRFYYGIKLKMTLNTTYTVGNYTTETCTYPDGVKICNKTNNVNFKVAGNYMSRCADLNQILSNSDKSSIPNCQNTVIESSSVDRVIGFQNGFAKTSENSICTNEQKDFFRRTYYPSYATNDMINCQLAEYAFSDTQVDYTATSPAPTISQAASICDVDTLKFCSASPYRFNCTSRSYSSPTPFRKYSGVYNEVTSCESSCDNTEFCKGKFTGTVKDYAKLSLNSLNCGTLAKSTTSLANKKLSELICPGSSKVNITAGPFSLPATEISEFLGDSPTAVEPNKYITMALANKYNGNIPLVSVFTSGDNSEYVKLANNFSGNIESVQSSNYGIALQKLAAQIKARMNRSSVLPGWKSGMLIRNAFIIDSASKLKTQIDIKKYISIQGSTVSVSEDLPLSLNDTIQIEYY